MIPENAQSWTSQDRTGWESGPWAAEPDKISWTDPTTGRPCLIVRGPAGALCGYVAVDPGHPLHGQDYEAPDVDVHGGLTYANRCQDTDTETEGICHVPAAGQPEDVWWFGFDCAHSGDLAPMLAASYRKAGLGTPSYARNDVYRDVPYVADECERLAEQLAAVTS